MHVLAPDHHVLQSLRLVQRQQPRVRHGAAQERNLLQARHGDVGDKAALAMQVARVLLARHAGAYALPAFLLDVVIVHTFLQSGLAAVRDCFVGSWVAYRPATGRSASKFRAPFYRASGGIYSVH